MDYELRAELLRRAGADAAAVAAFLDAADGLRATFATRPEAGTTGTPWPYVLLEWSPTATAPPVIRELLTVVEENTAWLRRLVSVRGWPGRSMVAEDGADAAWLLLQHAGSGGSSIGTAENLKLQASCVPLLQTAVACAEAHPRHLSRTWWITLRIPAATGTGRPEPWPAL